MTDTSRPRNVTINKLTVSSEQHWRTSASVITVGDPRGAHRAVDHHPGPLMPVLAGNAHVPVRIRHVGAALLAGRAQVQVRLGQQPHELEPGLHRLLLQLLMLQPERLLAAGPGDHRLRVPAYRGEQRRLRVLMPGCFPRDSLVCNAGVHGHRLSFFAGLNAAKNRGGGFPVQAPPTQQAPRPAPADRAQASRLRRHPASTTVCTHMSGHSRNARVIPDPARTTTCIGAAPSQQLKEGNSSHASDGRPTNSPSSLTGESPTSAEPQ